MSANESAAEIFVDKNDFSPGKKGRGFFLFDRELIADLEDAEQEKIFSAFEKFFADRTKSREPNALSRAPIERFFCKTGRSFIFRRYQRGGMMAHLTKDWFLRSGNTYRPVEEFRALKRLVGGGCAVPRPLGVFVESHFGGRVYRGALATEEIPAAKNFLSALREGLQESIAVNFARQAGNVAAQALREGICHADLHLGNILISGGSQIFLIDWDKAVGASEGSKGLLYNRFARSVQKHGRSELLIHAFAAGLVELK